jgi:maleate isomerase
MLRVGVLTPHGAIGPEAEFPAMRPGRVVTCVVRLSAEAAGIGIDPTTPSGLRALAASSLLDAAAETLGRGSLDAIVYASTSSGYALGFDAEAAATSRLSRKVGLPVSATCTSAVLALRVLGAERIALVHPPWFDAELNELGAAYFQEEGFGVVSSTSADLSQDPERIEAAAVCEWTSRHVRDVADAVFIGGNGFQAAGAIAALEAAIDRPVLTSNQVLLWNVLAQAGSAEVTGYGRLFASGHSVTMTTRNELVETLYRAFNARRIDIVVEHLREDVDWPNAWEGGRVHGRDAVRDYWTRQWSEIDPSVEPSAVTERSDGRLAVDVHQTVRALDGTLLGEGDVRHVYRFDGDLVARMDVEES